MNRLVKISENEYLFSKNGFADHELAEIKAAWGRIKEAYPNLDRSDWITELMEVVIPKKMGLHDVEYICTEAECILE